MTIILPSGNIVDTTGQLIDFNADGTVKLNTTTVYTPGSSYEFAKLRIQILSALAQGKIEVNTNPAVLPIILSVNPNPITYNGNQTISILGNNFNEGYLVGFSYTGYSSSGLSYDSIKPFNKTLTEIDFIMPTLPNNAGILIFTVINFDGGICNFTCGVL